MPSALTDGTHGRSGEFNVIRGPSKDEPEKRRGASRMKNDGDCEF